jgi:hypothetical protein
VKQSRELPIRGWFGEAGTNGCRAYRRREDGAYVLFDKQGGTGEGGEGGCDYRTIERRSGSEYVLSGTCFDLGGSKTATRLTLIVISNNEVIYAGRRYLRCK